MVIDLDRGVWMRSHPSIGMDIYMYVDDPGLYYDWHGNPVPNALAEAAGFDVESLERDHKRKVALDKAYAEIDQQFAKEGPKVHLEREGYKVVNIGLGRFNVLDAQEHLLNKTPLTKEQAEILMTHLAPAKAGEKPAKK